MAVKQLLIFCKLAAVLRQIQFLQTKTSIMKKILLILLCLPLIGFGQIQWSWNQDWYQLGQNLSISPAEYEFGASVSLSADGNTLAVGSGWETSSVLVYENILGSWIQKGLTLIDTTQYTPP